MLKKLFSVISFGAVLLFGVYNPAQGDSGESCFMMGHTQVLEVPGIVSSIYPLSSGKVVLIKRTDGQIQISKALVDSSYVSLTSLSIKNLFKADVKDRITEIQSSTSSRYTFIKIGAVAFVIDSVNFKLIKVSDDFSGGGFFTSDDLYLIIKNPSSISKLDLKTKQLDKIMDIEPRSYIFSDQSSKMLFKVEIEKFPSIIKSVSITDIASNKKTILSNNDNFKFISRNGKYLLHTSSRDYELFLPQFSKSKFSNVVNNYEWDQKTGRSFNKVTLSDGTKSIDIKFPMYSGALTYTEDSIINTLGKDDRTTSIIVDKDNYICVKKETISCNDCEVSKKISEQDAFKFAFNSENPSICKDTFGKNEKAWDSLLKTTFSSGASVDQRSIILKLTKMSKPGGLNIVKDLPFILGILSNPSLVNSYSDSVSSVMVNLLNISSTLYFSLLDQFPVMKLLAFAPASCLTSKEKINFYDRIYSSLKVQLMLAGNQRPFRDYSYFGQFSDYMNKAQKEDIADGIAQSAAEYLVAHEYIFRNVFFSKIYHFAYQRAKVLLGLPSADITDVVNVEHGSQFMSPVILSSKPIIGRQSILSDGGFYYAKDLNYLDLMNFSGSESLSQILWFTGDGNSYNAKILTKRIKSDSNNFVPAEKSFRYTDLFKDGVLRGVIMAGVNLGGIGTPVLEQYLSYYLSQGFEFSTPKPIDNTINYMQSKVSGNEPMDYFIKEAHSDGDDRNLFRITSRAKIRIGIKKWPKYTEAVEIVYPDDSGGSQLISNQTFGEWIRDREKLSLGQLIYINASCWSKNKAVAELSAAHSPVLTEIATLTSTYTFEDSSQNTERIILDGLRSVFDFDQIRDSLKNSARYMSGQSDVFIFPDEKKYDDEIRRRIGFTIETKIDVFEKILGGDWKPYLLEERINQ